MTRRSTGWTDAQKGDVRNYQPGMVVEFHQNAKGFKRGEKTVVGRDDDGLYLQRTDGSRTRMPLDQANRFDVYRTREIGIAKGDRIRITKNGEARVEGQTKGTKVNNGDIYTVEGFTKDGDIQLEKGRVLPRDWGHMQMGYVDTSYASQGKTTDRVFISDGNESLPATNQQQWYVSASRGREQAKVYVDSKKETRNAIARTGERLSAVELTGTKVRENWRARVYKSLANNRVSRFLKDRAEAISDYWNKRQGALRLCLKGSKAGRLERILERGEEDKAFTKERQHTAQAFTLHVESKDGRRSEGFAWAHYLGYRWEDNGDSEKLILIFGDRAVEIEGHNLGPLVDEIRECKLNSIREMPTARQMLLRNANPDGEPIISAIRSYPDVEEMLKDIKGEDDHDKAGYARRVQR